LHAAWRAYLAQQYATIGDLNAAWGNTAFVDFTDPAIRLSAVRPAQAAMRADWLRFVQRELGFTYAVATDADEPLYREFKGVHIGTSQSDVRKKLSGLQDKGKEMDFFVFSDKERARVYYDDAQRATAIIVTYIGKAASAPTPEAILGRSIAAKADGSLYDMVQYPAAGYWVAYSRTPGDEPLTIITMQKMITGSE
jgi:hypothetical protein